MGCQISKKTRMSDLRLGGKIGLNPWSLILPKHERRAKPCPISKKVRKQGKKGMSDLKKIKDVRSQIERKSGLDTEIFGCHTSWRRGKLCPISKKSCGEKEKMGSAISENVKKMRPIVEKKIWTAKSGRQWKKPTLRPTPKNNFHKKARQVKILRYSNSKKIRLKLTSVP